MFDNSEVVQKSFDCFFKNLLIDAGLLPDVVGLMPDLPKPKLLIGVSGGMDSMSLLHFILHSSVRTQVVVAHCNFHLRGEESDGDEAFVREHCAAVGVEFVKTDFDTLGYAQKYGLSIETAARELRYEWFGRLCKERGCSAVVVAHNANDNAETLFLNLLRGTGLRGLRGMSTLSFVPVSVVSKAVSVLTPEMVNRQEMTLLLRPLLGLSREQIEVYARASNVRWREDSSNKKSDCHRNILRNEIFPLFAEINPSFIRTINREMEYFADADNLVQSVVPNLIREGKIEIDELLKYVNWRLFLFYILHPLNFNSTVIDDISEHVLFSDSGNHIFLSPSHRLQVTSKYLHISERKETEISDTYIYNIGMYKIEGGTLKEITHGGVVKPGTAAGQGGDRIISIDVIPRDSLSDLKAPRGTTYLDADKVRFPFMLRRWKHGDWFRPLGMGGAVKKVSDLFVDLKYSASDKERALFLTLPYDAKSHICALLGERIDDSVKITPSTTKILRITL